MNDDPSLSNHKDEIIQMTEPLKDEKAHQIVQENPRDLENSDPFSNGFFECHPSNLSDWCSFTCPCYQCALNHRALLKSDRNLCYEEENDLASCCQRCHCPDSLARFCRYRSNLVDSTFGCFFVSCLCCIFYPCHMCTDPPVWYPFQYFPIPVSRTKPLSTRLEKCTWWALPCCGIATVAREIKTYPEYSNPNGKGRCCGANICAGMRDFCHDLCCSCPILCLYCSIAKVLSLIK